jgi:hypothetical protein
MQKSASVMYGKHWVNTFLQGDKAEYYKRKVFSNLGMEFKEHSFEMVAS